MRIFQPLHTKLEVLTGVVVSMMFKFVSYYITLVYDELFQKAATSYEASLLLAAQLPQVPCNVVMHAIGFV